MFAHYGLRMCYQNIVELELNILILSYHYHPDLSAGSFKNTALVSALEEKLSSDDMITVITTLPGRYNSFSVPAPTYKKANKLTIYRIAVPANLNGLPDQFRAFFIYALNVMRLVRGKSFDLIYVSSSRMMTALLGAGISKIKGVPLYVDFRDIFPDAIKDIIPSGLALFVKPVFLKFEQLIVARASKINLVSFGFYDYFTRRYPNKSFSNFTNGIDEEFVHFASRKKRTPKRVKLQVVYAGNIGKGQGLHSIIPKLAKELENEVDFKVIGDGAQRALLEAELNASCTKNVELLKPVERNRLRKIYDEADVLFLHLNYYEAFLKVLPSKIFEYAATGKPIWAGVSGYAAEFLKNEVENVVLFEPCNDKDAFRSFKELKIKETDRANFVNKYLRSKIMNEMARDIIETTNI